jgi:hypothetical protein
MFRREDLRPNACVAANLALFNTSESIPFVLFKLSNIWQEVLLLKEGSWGAGVQEEEQAPPEFFHLWESTSRTDLELMR